MIRFFLFYFLVIHYRGFRYFFRSKITGDTNYLSSPILAMNRILSHPVLGQYDAFVDIGCGEGLVGVFVRLVKKKRVILHDTQSDFLTMISMLCKCLFISGVNCSKDMLGAYPASSVFMCVWTAWSSKNRQKMIAQLSTIVPKHGHLVLVRHGLVHPEFVEVHKTTEIFAWGEASVYYYRHA